MSLFLILSLFLYFFCFVVDKSEHQFKEENMSKDTLSDFKNLSVSNFSEKAEKLFNDNIEIRSFMLENKEMLKNLVERTNCKTNKTNGTINNNDENEDKTRIRLELEHLIRNYFLDERQISAEKVYSIKLLLELFAEFFNQ